MCYQILRTAATSNVCQSVGELMVWLLNLQEMTGEYEEKKAAYENLAAGLESNMSKLEQVIEILTHPSLRWTFSPFIHTCTCSRCCCSTRHFRAQTSFLTCSFCTISRKCEGFARNSRMRRGDIIIYTACWRWVVLCYFELRSFCPKASSVGRLSRTFSFLFSGLLKVHEIIFCVILLPRIFDAIAETSSDTLVRN